MVDWSDFRIIYLRFESNVLRVRLQQEAGIMHYVDGFRVMTGSIMHVRVGFSRFAFASGVFGVDCESKYDLG